MSLVDLHCHILHQIDDGPRDISGSLEMAEAQVRCGVERVVATPHVSHRFPNEFGDIEKRHRELVSALAERDIPLDVDLGAEISLTAAMQLGDEALAELRLGDGDWLLIEPPSTVDALGIQSMLWEILGRGHRVLLAHPERMEAFQRSPDAIESLVNGGVKTQVTAAALNGRFGSSAERCAQDLFARGLVDVVASDAHNARHRPPGLEGPLRFAGLGERVAAVCRDEPLALLGN